MWMAICRVNRNGSSNSIKPSPFASNRLAWLICGLSTHEHTNSQFESVMNELKTCFKKVDYDLSALLHYIEIGDIGLPDIQRPFVWSNAKVRDLFDSMYRGFPVGYLLFWENAQINGTKHIGVGSSSASGTI